MEFLRDTALVVIISTISPIIIPSLTITQCLSLLAPRITINGTSM
jgi:hypothetical protein